MTVPSGTTILVNEINADLNVTLEITSGGTLDLQDISGDDLLIYKDFSDLAFFDVYGRFEISDGTTAVEDDFDTHLCGIFTF